MGWVMFSGIATFLIGLFLALKPDLWYEISESWKTYSDTDPSDFYIKSTKIGGWLFMILGVALIILPLVLK